LIQPTPHFAEQLLSLQLKLLAQAGSTWFARSILMPELSSIFVCSAAMPADVRFTPNSGNVQCNSACPLSANSGHR
ncbi:MAG: hypothetical protein WCB55_10955, partial [Pseudolabrys sp.]